MGAATSACNHSEAKVLTATEFTTEMAERLRSQPGITKVDITNEKQLEVFSSKGSFTCFMDSAYAEYLVAPGKKAEIMSHYSGSIAETALDAHHEDIVDRTHIIPVIKSRVYLENTLETLKQSGAKTVPAIAYDDLNPELIVMYAEDSGKTMRFLEESDLTNTHIERAQLRSLAVDNLTRLLPPIQRGGKNGLYIVMGGGTYGASLLLKDSLWTKENFDVKGDIVVAVPSRDMLIVTGSDDAEGIGIAKGLVEKEIHETSYPISAELFVYRDGKFTRFVPP